jgi:hypothetical protein
MTYVPSQHTSIVLVFSKTTLHSTLHVLYKEHKDGDDVIS